MKVGVINIYNFPHGLAPTNRIASYAKGLTNNGVKCEIISIVPKSGREALSDDLEYGRYVHFRYSTESSNRIYRSLCYRIDKWICRFRAVRYVYNSNQRTPFDCLIISYDSVIELFSTLPFFKAKGLRIITIADEYPRPIRIDMKDKLPKWKIAAYKFLNRYIDGRIVMTSNLETFFNGEICAKPSTIVSTIVDTERFMRPVQKKHPGTYLCYMGNMELSKDNVDNIIRAFAIIKDRYQDLQLFLYGAPSVSDRKTLTKLIDDLNLSDRIIIKGRVNFDDVPDILKSAKILVTSQPNTKRAEGGFPTKMGEYFMTGVPAILTIVGEIHKYVQDGVNAYMVEPMNPEKYASKLSYVLDNYEEALKVAANAKQMIVNKYSVDVAANKMISFIDSLQ